MSLRPSSISPGGFLKRVLFFLLAAVSFTSLSAMNSKNEPIYIYTLQKDAVVNEGEGFLAASIERSGVTFPGGNAESYDESVAVATLQGIINRNAPSLYVVSRKNMRPQYWLDILSKDGRWLSGRERQNIEDLDTLVFLAGKRLKGAVIWDPAVPATVNVATTIAGVEDAVVLSPEFADKYLEKWHLPVIKDLRGMFTGAETGSKKNDAYRWAIREYLITGKCSSSRVFLSEDSALTRERGDNGYAIPRDWAVKNRSFVFDLSPWGDEAPGDEPDQKIGLDFETYKMILTELKRQADGRHMTELVGFFAFGKYSKTPYHKSKHEPVMTEMESVWNISPYNIYKSSISSDLYNQSFHSQAPRHQLKQIAGPAHNVPLEKKTYICVGMGDYDSATLLYDYLPRYWDNADRGKIPLAWGINPNLLETYPDVIDYFYSTATGNDTFVSDANAAGYITPTRVAEESLPLFTEHNKKFFKEADMTISPMVIDFDQPTPVLKDAFREFAPDGYGAIVWDVHNNGGRPPIPHVWKGMPLINVINDLSLPFFNDIFIGPEKAADLFSNTIKDRGSNQPGFYLYRIGWVSPQNVRESIESLRAKHPELNIEIVDPRTFFKLYKEYLETSSLSKSN